MPQTQRRLFIFDHAFTSLKGHHFEYNMSLAAAAVKQRLKPLVIANQRCEVVSKDKTIVPWFRFDRRPANGDANSGATFTREVLAFLDQECAGPEDLVLIHTMALSEFTEFMALFDRVLWGEAVRLPTCYLLLRRDPDEHDESQLGRAREVSERAFACSILRAKIILCTDTDQLSEAWAETIRHPFVTLPIPFRHELLDIPKTSNPAGEPRSIVYLGDARNEKGYQLLPEMVWTLWDRFIETGMVKCVFQSNFNIAGGESGIPEARLRLQRFPHAVQLLTHKLQPDEYYDVLVRGDIIVLPYDPERYSRRSSGVLNEAVVAGKVAVVPRGSWLASQVNPAGAIIYDHPWGLSAGVVRALENFEVLSANARAHAPLHAARHSPELFIARLLEHASAPAGQTGPSVLCFVDGDGLANRTDAGAMATNQLAALTRLGYRVHAVLQRTHVDDDHNVSAMREWMGRVCDTIRALPLASAWGAGYLPFANGIGLYPEHEIFTRRGSDLDQSIRYHETFAAPAGLVAALRRDPPELVFVNCAQSIPFARELAGPEIPIVCESHDIQSFHFARRNARGLRQRDIDREIGLLSNAAQVITVNRLAKQYLDRLIEPERVAFIPQPILDPPASVESLAGAANLAEVIEACGPFHASVRREFAGELPGSSPLRRLRVASSIDLLYVSSRRDPNLREIQMFLHHAYFPMLEPLGINLMIVGDICEDLRNVENPNIFLVYRLKDLAPLYAAAKVIILPIFEDAGSDVETLDALGRGKPIVATTFALCGIRFDATEFPTFDEWDGFAGRIKELLDDRGLRLASAKQALDLSRRNGNDGLYADRLNAVVRAAIGSRAREDLGRKDLRGVETSAIEWTPAFGVFNSLVRDWLTDGCFSETALRAFRDAPLERSRCEQIFRALLRGDAPGRAIPANAELRMPDERRHSSGFEAFWADIEPAYHDDLSSSADGDKLEFDVAPGVEAFIEVETDGESRRIVLRGFEPGADATGIAGVHAIPRPEGTAVLVQRFKQTYKNPRHADPISHFRGFHDAEHVHAPRGVARWTGPGLDASLTLSIKSVFDTIFSVEVLGALTGRIFETAAISVNGFRLPTLKSGDGSKLIALAPATFLAKKHSRLRLGLHVVETLAPGTGDQRKLGLRIADIVTEASLTPGRARSTPSPFVEAVGEMTSRSPDDFVFLCYRDLLLRNPDPGGLINYTQELSEGKSRISILESFLTSPEFATIFDIPNYGRKIHQHLVSSNRFPA